MSLSAPHQGGDRCPKQLHPKQLRPGRTPGIQATRVRHLLETGPCLRSGLRTRICVGVPLPLSGPDKRSVAGDLSRIAVDAALLRQTPTAADVRRIRIKTTQSDTAG